MTDSTRVVSEAAFATATERVRCLIAHKGGGREEESKARRGQEVTQAGPAVVAVFPECTLLLGTMLGTMGLISQLHLQLARREVSL